MWVGVGAGVGVGVGVDFSKPESESESESLKFGGLHSPAYHLAAQRTRYASALVATVRDSRLTIPGAAFWR